MTAPPRHSRVTNTRGRSAAACRRQARRSVPRRRLALVCLVALWMPAHAAAADPAELVTLRAGRHPDHLRVVLEFDGPFAHTSPQPVDGGVRLRLRDAVTAVRAYRQYRSFDGWLRLTPEGTDIRVDIGLPAAAGPPRTARLEDPARLVLHFPLATAPTRAVVAAAPDPAAPPPAVAPSMPEATLAPPRPPPAAAPASSAAPGGGPGLDYVGSRRQMDLIRARIYRRQGRTQSALRLYRQLRRRHPQDAEIWGDLAETLVDAGHFARAAAELAALRRAHPDDPRAGRLQARLYVERGRPAESFPVFERLLARRPRDAGLWAAYGYARLDAGEWAPALEHFCRVLETDPDNRDVRRSVHAILRAHRPRLEADWRSYRQDVGDVRIDAGLLRYRRHLADALRLEAESRRIAVRRPAQAGVAALDASAADLSLMLRYRWHRRWQFDLGGGVYQGLGDGAGPALGVEAMLWERAYLRGEAAWRRPWYDPVEAAAREGSADRARLTFDWAVADGLSVQAGAGQRDYRLRGPGAAEVDYGRERSLSASLTGLVFRRPDVYLGYRFERSTFAYADPAFTPVGMVESETLHSVTLSVEHWPCTYWAWRLAGALQWDTSRAIDGWTLAPGLVLRLGNRIDLEFDFAHSSESGTVDGGASDTLGARGTVIF